MSAGEKKERTAQLRRNEQKWTRVLMDAGWTVLPSVILERQQALGLDAVDVNILMHLARHWWYADNPPHPSKRAIAECMGIDRSTVRRRIAAMERDGLIRREPRYDDRGQTTNVYHFDGLIRAATPLAEEAVQAKETAKKEAAARRVRKRRRVVERPKLHVVPDNPEQEA